MQGNKSLGEDAVIDFRQHYAKLFDALGYPLTARSAVSQRTISEAEARLGASVPKALREYYLVAGNERRFNHCLNQLISPGQWSIDSNRLLFMEENQTILWWGVNRRKAAAIDPYVFQGINADPISWRSEQCRCSKFLEFMIHYHAANGGLPFSGRADITDDVDYALHDHGWRSHGELGQVAVYSRRGQVLCLNPPGNLPFMRQWSVTVATKTKASFNSLQNEMGLSFL